MSRYVALHHRGHGGHGGKSLYDFSSVSFVSSAVESYPLYDSSSVSFVSSAVERYRRAVAA